MLRSGSVVCAVLFSAGAAGTSGAQGISLGVQQQKVERYGKIELLIDVERVYDHPFDPCEVQVNVTIATPGGRTLTVPAFFGQEYERRDLLRDGKTIAWCYPRGTGAWKARFAPMEIGTHTAHAVLNDAHDEISSAPVKFECVASASKGFLGVCKDDPRFLRLSEGEPFFAFGQDLAFIGETQYVTLTKAEEIFGKLAANGANFLRIWTCCEDWAMAVEARKSAWGRSWAKSSFIVPMPDDEARKCIKIEGQNGTSVTADPSHPVALLPGMKYVLSGKLRMDGPQAVRVQVGNNRWDIAATSDWQSFEKGFTTGANEYRLGRTTFALVGEGKAWLDALSLKEAAGGADLLWEADVKRPARGYCNPLDCFMLDQIVEAADRNRMYLMLCVITRDLYMSTLSKVDSPEYRQAVTDAKKLMRYAVARWGYSTNVAAWEYFNEMDPGKPTDKFYEEVGKYLEQVDIYRHLRTTSTWAPSARDCRHAQLDIAQEHHYMRPDDRDFKDEVECIVSQARWLRDNAPGKPALIGEFGLATDKWGLSDYMKQDREGVHFHNCLWASAFSGVSGTAMFWWWDQLDRQDAYHHYKPLTTFLAAFSPVGLQPTSATISDARVRILGYEADNRAYLWLVNRQATWWNLVVEKREPDAIDTATVTIEDLTPGSYTILWWDTYKGEPVNRLTLSCDQGRLELAVPAFTRDIACRVIPTQFAQ